MTTKADPFALYVTSIEGHVVPRYGSPGVYVGATRLHPHGWSWSKDVVAIGHDEYRQYRIEYEKAIAAGDLKRSSAAALEASDKARTEKRQAEIDAKKKLEEDAASEAKAKAAEAEPLEQEAAEKAAAEQKAAEAAAAKAKAEADKSSSDGKKKGTDR